MSSVTFMEECPSISETTLALMSFESSSVAQVWRRSWKRIGGRPAFFKSSLKERFLRFEGLIIVPVSVAKMSPPAGRESPFAPSLLAGERGVLAEQLLRPSLV